MLAFSVVEHPDVVEGIGFGFIPGGIGCAVHALVLETVKPAFSGGIVSTVALPAHGTGHAVVSQLLLKYPTGVLAAPI